MSGYLAHNATCLGRRTDPPTYVRAPVCCSPVCPHCVKVLKNFLAPLMDTQRGRLEVVIADITQQDGKALFVFACGALEIPHEYVPLLSVGG